MSKTPDPNSTGASGNESTRRGDLIGCIKDGPDNSNSASAIISVRLVSYPRSKPFGSRTQLRNYLINHAAHSDRTGALLHDIDAKLGDLQLASSSSSPDGGSGKVLGEELPALAKEVAQVDTLYSDKYKWMSTQIMHALHDSLGSNPTDLTS
ncbi:hypothetical protein HAX54_037633 [Datura stramonium]|uniref:Uncharacterized protein n=1 Tax=Datura stramonium TaxID=4076 RepID=A0ABS8VLD5_DATST|nr:hypothetical protein [Datura stramonium]